METFTKQVVTMVYTLKKNFFAAAYFLRFVRRFFSESKKV